MNKKKLTRIGTAVLAATIAASSPILTLADGHQTMTVTVDAQNNLPGPDASGFSMTGYTGEYDGQEHPLSAAIGDDSVLTYSNDGITYTDTVPTVKNVNDSGTYYVKATKNNKSVVTSATVTISKKSATLTVENASKKDGSADPAFTATSSGVLTGDTLNYTLTRSNSTEVVGTYTGVLTATLGSNPNYDITVNNGDFEIIEYKLKDFSVAGYEGTYDGQPHGLTVTGVKEGVVVEYSSDDGATWTTTAPEFTDVASIIKPASTWLIMIPSNYTRSYKVKATYGADTVIKDADIIIKPAPVFKVIVDDKTKILGEADPEFTLSYEGFVDDGWKPPVIVERSDKTEAIGKYRISIHEDQDKFQASATDADLNEEYMRNELKSNNYHSTINGHEVKSIYRFGTLTIVSSAFDRIKENAEITGYTGEYDGKSHEAVTVNNTEDAKIEYSTDGGNTWSETVPTVKDTKDNGEYQVKVTKDEESFIKAVTVTIHKKRATITAENASKKRGSYDPAFMATVTGAIAGEALDYTVVRTNTDEAIGTYSGVLSVLPGDNKNYDVTVYNGDFTITDNDFDDLKNRVTTDGYKGEYDGRAHDAVTVKNVGDAKVEYSRDGKNWSETIPTVRNVNDSGDYFVKFTKDGESFTRTVNVVISKKNLSVVVENASKTEGNNDPKISAKITGAVEDLDYTVKRTNNSEEVGTYRDVLDISFNRDYPNYNITVDKGDFTIKRKSSSGGSTGGGSHVVETGDKLKDFSVSDYNGTYDSNYHSVVVKGAEGADIKYSVNGGEWTSEKPSYKDFTEDKVNIRVWATVDGESSIKEGAVTISKAPLSIVPKDITYTSGQDAPSFTATVNGLQGNDKILFDIYRDAADDDSVGIHKSVLLINVNRDNPNYDISTGTGDIEILESAKAPVNPGTGNNGGSGVQGVKVIGYEGTYDGQPHSVTVTGAKKSDIMYSVNGAEATLIRPYVKDVSDSTDDIFVTVDGQSVKSFIKVNKKPVTIKVDDLRMSAGGGIPKLTATVSGVVNHEMLDYELVIDTKKFDSDKVGTYKGVITAVLKDSDVNDNYEVKVENGSIEVTKGAVRDLRDVEIDSFTGEYDGQSHTIKTNVDSDDRFTVEYSLDGKNWSKRPPKMKDAEGIKHYKVRVTQGYDQKTFDADFGVKAKKVVIKVNNAEKLSGNDDPKFTAEVSGLSNKDIIDYEIVRDSNDQKPDAIGEHVITAKVLERYPNYDIHIEDGKLIIKKNGLSTSAKVAIGALVTVGVGAALAFTGVLQNIWMLLLLYFLKDKRKKLHGLLTDAGNRFVETEIKTSDGKLIQDVVDEMNELNKTPDEILEVLKESGNITYLPVGTKMEINYISPSNINEVLVTDADEERLYKSLCELKNEGIKHIEVTFVNKMAKFESRIKF